MKCQHCHSTKGKWFGHPKYKSAKTGKITRYHTWKCHKCGKFTCVRE